MCMLSLILDFWNQNIESFQSVLHVSVSTGAGRSLVGAGGSYEVSARNGHG